MNTPEFTNPPVPSHFYDDPNRVAPFIFKNVRFDEATHTMKFIVHTQKCIAQDNLFKPYGYNFEDKKFIDIIKIQILQMYHISAYKVTTETKGLVVEITAKILPEKNYIKDWLKPFNDELSKYHHSTMMNDHEVNFYEDPFHDACKNMVSVTYKKDTMIEDFINVTTPMLKGTKLPHFIKYNTKGKPFDFSESRARVHYNSIFAETDIPNVCIGCFFIERIFDNHYYALTRRNATIILDNFTKPENDEPIEYDTNFVIENLKKHLLQVFDISDGLNTFKDIIIHSANTFYCSTLDEVVVNVEYHLNFYQRVDSVVLRDKGIYMYKLESDYGNSLIIRCDREYQFIHDILEQVHVQHVVNTIENTDGPNYMISIKS